MNDYHDYLRVHDHRLWDKDSKEARYVRDLGNRPDVLQTPTLPRSTKRDVTFNEPGRGSVYSVRQAGKIIIGKGVKFALTVCERKSQVHPLEEPIAV